MLPRQQWLALFDHVFTNQPTFIYYAAVNKLTHTRTLSLLCLQNSDGAIIPINSCFGCVFAHSCFYGFSVDRIFTIL